MQRSNIIRRPLSLRSRREYSLSRSNPKIIEVLLAKERTLLAWQRAVFSLMNVAFAAVALGLAMLKFFETSVYRNILLPVGIFLLAFAFVTFCIACVRHIVIQSKLRHIREYRGRLDTLYFDQFEPENYK